MKRFILAVLFLATPVYAANNPDVLSMKNGITFQHKKHQASLKGECKNCHRKEKDAVVTGHIDGFGKDSAHRMCRTCHTMKRVGPVSCKDCHGH